MWSRKLPVLQRILVNLLGDERAIAGVLLRQGGDWLVLGDAELHEAGLKAQPMDGDIYIDRHRVAFIQATTPKG